eukprot:2813628-Pleurochrysis_carterae.AAC.1
MPDSARVGLAVQGLQELPQNWHSAVIEKAFIGGRSHVYLAVVALELALEICSFDIKLSDSEICGAAHRKQQFEGGRARSRCKRLE